MKRSDKERLKKIVATWESLKAEMHKRSITPELLLEDEFSQWAVTTPLYNIWWRPLPTIPKRGSLLWSTASSTGTAGSGCGPLPCSSAPWTGQNTPMPRRNIALNCRRSPAPPGTDAVKRIHFYFGFTETFSDFLYCKSLHKAL